MAENKEWPLQANCYRKRTATVQGLGHSAGSAWLQGWDPAGAAPLRRGAAPDSAVPRANNSPGVLIGPYNNRSIGQVPKYTA